MQTASFKLYSAFVNSYDKSLDALGRVEATRLWAEIMKKVDNLVRDERPLTFETLLVTPIQRIPRYLLLLKVTTSSLACDSSFQVSG